MNESNLRLLFLAHLGSSLYMSGVIWFVQVVHYPLFATVDRESFANYEQRHTALTTWIVGPPMLIEGATAILLVWFCPWGVPQWSLWMNLTLLAVIWLSTALVQVPCHHVLSRDFHPVVHHRLVWTNWLRTFAWSLHAGLVLWMAWTSLRFE